jgi:hypothetical protein
MRNTARDRLQQAVDDLARKLHRSVVVDDSSVHMLVISPHYGDEDDVRVRALLQRDAENKAVGHVLAQGVTSWVRAGVIPAYPEIGMRARVCVPIRWRGDLLGLLMVMDADGTLTTAELTRITAAAEDMAPYLSSIVGDDLADGEDALWDLLSPQPMNRRHVLSDIADRHDVELFSHLAAIHMAAAELDETTAGHAEMALKRALRAESGADPAPILYAVRDGTALVLIGMGPSTSRKWLANFAKRLVTRVNELSAQRFHCVAGVGRIVEGLDRAIDSADQAMLAWTAGRGLVSGPVVFWDELGAYASLLRIPPSGLVPGALPDEVRRLLEVDSDGQLTETVRAYLDHGGSSPGTAEALHVHRTTLYYRLGRLEELAGLDLADGRTRLALHVGLELLHIGRSIRQK